MENPQTTFYGEGQTREGNPTYVYNAPSKDINEVLSDVRKSSSKSSLSAKYSEGSDYVVCEKCRVEKVRVGRSGESSSRSGSRKRSHSSGSSSSTQSGFKAKAKKSSESLRRKMHTMGSSMKKGAVHAKHSTELAMLTTKEKIKGSSASVKKSFEKMHVKKSAEKLGHKIAVSTRKSSEKLGHKIAVTRDKSMEKLKSSAKHSKERTKHLCNKCYEKTKEEFGKIGKKLHRKGSHSKERVAAAQKCEEKRKHEGFKASLGNMKDRIKEKLHIGRGKHDSKGRSNSKERQSSKERKCSKESSRVSKRSHSKESISKGGEYRKTEIVKVFDDKRRCIGQYAENCTCKRSSSSSGGDNHL